MYQRAGLLVKAILSSALSVSLLGLFAPSAHADSLYATTFSENQLLQINISTGAGTLVGVIPGPSEIADLHLPDFLYHDE